VTVADSSNTHTNDQVQQHADPALSAAAAEVADLTTRILELRDAYYERDEVLVSDEEYDGLMRRLEELERLFPELQGQDSPTQTVGGRAASLFDPVTHAERMLSLDNVFSLDDFAAWAAKVERDSGRAVDYLCELKIDGLAISLRYENGRLTSAATRGDGVVGEDVTENIARVQGIPARLSGTGHPPLVEVRARSSSRSRRSSSSTPSRPPQGRGCSRTRGTRHPVRCDRSRKARTPPVSTSCTAGSVGSGCSCTASAPGRTRPWPARARCTGCSPAGDYPPAPTTASRRRLPPPPSSSSTSASTATRWSTRSTAS